MDDLPTLYVVVNVGLVVALLAIALASLRRGPDLPPDPTDIYFTNTGRKLKARERNRPRGADTPGATTTRR